MRRRYTLRFDMLSDWHVGAGVGRPGSVDRLLLRDADGLPYLPAKSIRGVWRDAAERVAGALKGNWLAVVDLLFGDQPAQNRGAVTVRPRETLLLVTPARLPQKLRAELTGSPELREAVAFVKPGVKIDDKTGRAEDGQLRFEEVARAGAVLTATATLDTDRLGPAAGAAEALLLAATRLVTGVGGKRRRGNGRCTLTVTDADVAAAIETLAGTADPQVSAVADPDEKELGEAPKADGEWVEFPFALQLSGPVAVPSHTVGNVVKSLDFIPGTYLLPLLTRAFPERRPDVARGDVMVTHATRDVGAAAGRPTPFALFAPKDKGFDEAVSALVVEVDGLKQQRGGYVGRGAAKPTVEKAATTVQTHNVIDDKVQRPTTDVGGVYSYEALEPGVFRGSIVARKGLLPNAPAVLTKAGADLRLGSSKKDDYGRATLTVFDPIAPAAQPAGGAHLDIWLLSDALLRGASLRPEPTVDRLRLVLEDAFKLAGSNVTLVVARHDGPERREMTYARQRRTESGHTGWVRPRPSLVGLQAGTCDRFVVTGNLTVEALTRVATEGVGERTAEGYGRVAFNHPLLTAPQSKEANAAFPVPGGDAGSGPEVAEAEAATDYATVIVRAAWKGAIRNAVLHATDAAPKREALFGWKGPRPTLSQLGGLRATLPFLRGPADAPKVTNWLSAVQANKRRESKWPKAVAGQPDSLTLTANWFSKPDAVWDVIADQGVPLPVLESVPAATLRDKLWAFAVRALVEAGVRAHKRDTEPRGEAARAK